MSFKSLGHDLLLLCRDIPGNLYTEGDELGPTY